VDGASYHFSISFSHSSIEVSQETIFSFQSNEEGGTVTSVVVVVLNFVGKKFCCSHFTCDVRLGFVIVLRSELV
jgi:hypothetical protein